MRLLKRRPLLGVALFAGLFAAACYPVRLEADWPSLSLLGEEQNIVLSYHDRVVMIDPEDGLPVELRNADGEVRLDDQGNPRIWDFRGTEGQGTQFYASPIPLDADTLLIPSYKPTDNLLYELDLPTARVVDGAGTPVSGHVVADLVAHGDLVYVGFSERDFIAFDKSDMSERWRLTTEHGIWAEPLIVEDTLYLASLDHHLYALDAESGEVLWKVNLQGSAAGTPVFDQDRLYIGSFARKIFSISTQGEIVAEFATQDWVWGSPALLDGILYAGDMSGTVYALDARDDGLALLWRNKVAERAIRATPLVSEDYVIVGSRDHRLYWLNRGDGSQVNDVEGPRVRTLSNEVLSDLLLIEPGQGVDIPEPYVIASAAANDNLLVAFTLSKGERVWTYGR